MRPASGGVGIGRSLVDTIWDFVGHGIQMWDVVGMVWYCGDVVEKLSYCGDVVEPAMVLWGDPCDDAPLYALF